MVNDKIFEHTCPVCKNKYQGESWKTKCYDCYKNFRYSKRIYKLGYKSNVYLTHPNVTAEELDKWIKDNDLERGWGAEEWNPNNPKVKIWLDNTNFD